jgi:hypothetical protein
VQLQLLIILHLNIIFHDIQEIIAKTRAISRTIKLLSSSSTDERHAAISFLLELSKSELLLENIGSTAGSILILTTMKFNSSSDPIAAEKAGEVLENLEKCPKNIKYMAESGYLDPLQRHLVEGKIWPLYRKQNYFLLCVRLT